jgi:hypothetical protein
MKIFRIITTLIFLMIFLKLHAQHVDSVQLDLKRLNGIDFFNKYTYYDYKDTPTRADIKVTKLIWSVHHLRRENELLRRKGVKTITIIEGRPSKQNPYYIIGHYQLFPKANRMFRMSLYKINTKRKVVYFEHWFDSVNDKWQRVK